MKITFDVDPRTASALLKYAARWSMTLNTEAKKARTLTIKLSIVPTENRDSVAVRAEVSSKLVPVKPIDGALLLGGTDAEPIVMEYTPQVPGQQSFDPSVDTEPKVVKLA